MIHRQQENSKQIVSSNNSNKQTITNNKQEVISFKQTNKQKTSHKNKQTNKQTNKKSIENKKIAISKKTYQTHYFDPRELKILRKKYNRNTQHKKLTRTRNCEQIIVCVLKKYKQ